MIDYNYIDPQQYDTSYKIFPRERYLLEHWYPLIKDAISKYCKDKVVLDVGCGTGRYSGLISNYTDYIFGLDISKTMLNHAQNKYPHLNFILGNTHNLPFKKESINTVVCIGLFEYAEAGQILKEIRGVLKADGICIVQRANKYGAFRMLNRLIYKFRREEYFCKEASFDEMYRLFRKNGFKVLKFMMDDGLIWLPNFLDRLFGRKIYLFIESFFRVFNRNPFSNAMLFVVKKE
ncbi:MAG: class I SAM-dependent methyltransferase [Candidatus Ratteibacteria bacterium]|nr:class I SAM-dependent methyltransferase [Candidatus Ratteibacteria bacterium]